MNDREFIEVDKFPGGVESDPEVSDFGMPALVFCESVGRVIITIKRCGICREHIKAFKELVKKDNFM